MTSTPSNCFCKKVCDLTAGGAPVASASLVLILQEFRWTLAGAQGRLRSWLPPGGGAPLVYRETVAGQIAWSGEVNKIRTAAVNACCERP